ncbi:MAG: DNA polymerase Y family protein [Gammaproteobacteria bacterium]|nr:DNA polymerase Y family protein [Gammaproteobacteria bacterium]
MKDPDSEAQLPLPCIAPESGAQLIRLPAGPKSLAKGHSPTAATNGTSIKHATRRSKSNSLWYALYFPQLKELDSTQQKKYLDQLADHMQRVSSTISFHPLALICEVRSSLKYFAGIDAIHQKLQKLIEEQLQQWGLADNFFYAASPTVSGSLLLAKSGHNVLVYRQKNLRSALGQLSTDVLDLNKEQRRRLLNMGIRHLRDIWRLPSEGLCKRFGSNFVNQLDKALGKAAEPTRNYIPPPTFVASYDLPYEFENLDQLLPIADELLAQLCDFLQQRDLSTSSLVLSLFHERRDNTEVNIRLRMASRIQQHLMLLLETHFNRLSIPAPVVAIKIEVKKFDAFFTKSNSLLKDEASSLGPHGDSNLIQFMEQLQARLGKNHVKSVRSAAQHCPEYSSLQIDYKEKPNRGGRVAMPTEVSTNPRPLWLLQEPKQLNINKGRLFYRKPITIVSGPERIETHWWSGTDVRRDYYVAKELHGSRLWIYKEKDNAGNWYLHGIFS